MRTYRPRLWLSLCALALSLSAAAESAAQPLPGGTAPSKDDAMSDQARELFSKGAKAAEQQKWDQCRAALLAALSIKRHPQIAGNLAACEAKLGLYRDAAEHSAYFLSDMRPGTSTERRMSGQSILNEAMGKIAAATIHVSVEGADVMVDGRSVGTAPLPGPIFLDPGKHTLEARQEGYTTARTTLETQAGTTPAVTLRLEKPAATILPGTPSQGGEMVRKPNKTALIGGAVATGLALGLGVATTILANGKASAAQDKHDELATAKGPNACGGAAMSTSDCTALHGLWADRATFSNVAAWSFISAGVLAVATVTVTLVGTKQPAEKAAVFVSPTVGLGAGGVSVQGAW